MERKYLIAIIASFMVSACGGGNDDASNFDNVDPENDEIVGYESPIAASGEPTTLEGSWKKPCGIVDEEDDSLYDEVVISFSGNSFSSDIKNYTDANCTSPMPIYGNPKASGIFVIGNTTVTGEGITATEIDTHITEANGAPFELTEYGIFYKDGNTLYLGDDTYWEDGSSLELRMTMLDFDRVFIKQ